MKVIKSLLIVSVAIALQITVSASPLLRKTVKPSGDIETITFSIPLSSYSKIDVSSVANVKIIEGEGDIVVKIDSELVSYIIVEVSDGELEIKLDDELTVKGSCKIDVLIPYKGELNEISASGVVSVVSEVVLTGDEISISAEGVSSVTAKVDGKDCEVEALGVSKVYLECKSETLEVAAYGKSDIILKVKTGICEAEALGMSDITISGETNHAELSVAGMSDINAKDLIYKTIEVEESGMSDVSYRKN